MASIVAFCRLLNLIANVAPKWPNAEFCLMGRISK